VLKPDAQRVKAAQQALIRDASQATPANWPHHLTPFANWRPTRMRWTRRLRLGMAGRWQRPRCSPSPPQPKPLSLGQLTDLVNPFIGTENDGNTYPGAAVPFGMVQFSPDTGHNTGYDYSRTTSAASPSCTFPASAAGWAATCPYCPRPGT